MTTHHRQSIITSTFADTLREAFDGVHVLDREAEEILSQNEPNYVEAISCHKTAYDKLEGVLSAISIEQQHRMMLCKVQRPLLEALYSHLEYHFNMRSSLMSREQSLTKEAKRKAYIESIREKRSELSSLDVNNKVMDRQFTHQEDLLDSLEEKCSHVIEDLPEELALQKLNAMKSTIDKLKNKNAHCKQLLDGLVTDYIQIQEELMAAKGEHKSRAISDQHGEQTATLSAAEHIDLDPGAALVEDDTIQFAPLETPPDFEIPDDVDFSLNSSFHGSSFAKR